MGCSNSTARLSERGGRIAPPNNKSEGSAVNPIVTPPPPPPPTEPPTEPASEASSAVSDHPPPAPPPAPAQPAVNSARALVKALKQGDTATVSSLIDGDAALLERRGMWENTPLLVACHYLHSELALMLLARGADAAASNEAGATALLFACVDSIEGVATRLLEMVDAGGSSILLDPPPAMVYSRSTDSTDPRTPLQAAAENGFLAGVSGLLARGAARDPLALMLSASRGHTSCCEALLQAVLPPDGSAPADGAAAPSKWLAEALTLSAQRGHEGVIKALAAHPLTRQAVPECGGAAVRAACALRGGDAPSSGEGSGLRERIVACLCDAGAPTDFVPEGSNDGSTALHIAAGKGLATTVSLLLAAGADAAKLNAAGDSAAELARRAGHEQLATTIG